MISLQTLNPALNSTLDPKQAIAQASARTGVDFDYLLKTAQRESSLDSSAKARTSSAAGLFQFIEQTWLGMVKNHGAKYGLETEAAAITQDANGRYQVADAGTKSAILALRHDAETSSLMAAEYTQEASTVLEAGLGRSPREAELYMAHFLGAGSAARLISLAETTPQASAADTFPQAAAANRSIFYNRDGSARSAAEVVENLSSKHDGTKASPPPAAPSVIAEHIGQEIAVPLPARGNALFVEAASQIGPEVQPYPTKGVTLSPMMVKIFASLDPLSASKAQHAL